LPAAFLASLDQVRRAVIDDGEHDGIGERHLGQSKTDERRCGSDLDGVDNNGFGLRCVGVGAFRAELGAEDQRSDGHGPLLAERERQMRR